MTVTNFVAPCFVLVFALYVHHKIATLHIIDVDTTYLTTGVQFSNQRSPNMSENDAAFQQHSRRLGIHMAPRPGRNILYSMLLLCGDVMENPGPSANEGTPTRFTCVLCSLDVSWKDRGLCCDECARWFHRHCQNPLSLHVSPESLSFSGVAWFCAVCGCPNYSTICSYHTVDLSNKFDPLSNSSRCSSSPSSPGVPIASSSPNVNTTESFDCSFVSLPSRTDSQPALQSSSQTQRGKFRPVRLLNLNAQAVRDKKLSIAIWSKPLPQILLFVPKLG